MHVLGLWEAAGVPAVPREPSQAQREHAKSTHRSPGPCCDAFTQGQFFFLSHPPSHIQSWSMHCCFATACEITKKEGSTKKVFCNSKEERDRNCPGACVCVCVFSPKPRGKLTSCHGHEGPPEERPSCSSADRPSRFGASPLAPFWLIANLKELVWPLESKCHYRHFCLSRDRLEEGGRRNKPRWSSWSTARCERSRELDDHSAVGLVKMGKTTATPWLTVIKG